MTDNLFASYIVGHYYFCLINILQGMSLYLYHYPYFKLLLKINQKNEITESKGMYVLKAPEESDAVISSHPHRRKVTPGFSPLQQCTGGAEILGRGPGCKL